MAKFLTGPVFIVVVLVVLTIAGASSLGTSCSSGTSGNLTTNGDNTTTNTERSSANETSIDQAFTPIEVHTPCLNEAENSTIEPSVNDGNGTRKQREVLAAQFLAKARSYWAYTIGIGINTYVCPMIIILGLIGNVLALIVMLQPRNRRISCCVYMAALAVNDTGMLGGMILYQWVYHEIIRRPLPVSECKAGAYAFQFFSVYGVFLIVFMTIDRFIAVCFPLKSRALCTTKHAKIAVTVGFIYSCIVNVPHYMYSEVLANNLCTAFGNSDFFGVLYSWANISINCFIPFSAILIMNCCIIFSVRRSRSFMSNDPSPTADTVNNSPQGIASGGSSEASSVRDSEVTVTVGARSGSVGSSLNSGVAKLAATEARTTAPSDRTSSRDRQLTVVLVLVSFALLVFTLPQYIRYVVFHSSTFYSGSPKQFAVYVLIYNITNKWFTVNNAINFYIYCLKGSKFRQDVRNLFAKKG